MDKRPKKPSSGSCSNCQDVWHKQGKTYCLSEPDTRPSMPAYCPSGPHAGTISDSFDLYRGDSEDARLARMAAKVEGLCYQKVPGSEAVNARWTRVEDMLALASLMGYRKIGIATCIGLLEECQKLSEILKAQGFESYAACCKAGRFDKRQLGLDEENKVRPGTFEPACNPVAQAQVLNTEQVDMNIIVGLCVGHDMLFSKHAQAPVTTLVVKDRVTGHNPAAVLYGQNFYYKRLQTQPVLTAEEVARHREGEA